MRTDAGPGLFRDVSPGSQCLKLGWLLLVCLALAGCAGITLNAVEDGRLVAAGPIGGAEINRGGTRLRPHPHMAVQPGDEIRTGPETTVILSYMDGTRVYVEPDTRIRLGSIFVFFGEVLIKARGLFAVDTRFATAGSEGTQYLVRVERGDQVRVVVAEGRVGVGPRGQRQQRTIIGVGQGGWFIGEGPWRSEPVSRREVAEIHDRTRALDELVREHEAARTERRERYERSDEAARTERREMYERSDEAARTERRERYERGDKADSGATGARAGDGRGTAKPTPDSSKPETPTRVLPDRTLPSRVVPLPRPLPPRTTDPDEGLK